tara:strand:+ start:327 stop:590 length:264 start_codon:yes stop_codon:yes gene_type:complete
MAKSTSDYYKKNPAAKRKRLKQQAKYNKRKDQVSKRVELNRENRRRGTYGNGDKKDVSHTKCGTTVLEGRSKNRARNRGKLKCKKRK